MTADSTLDPESFQSLLSNAFAVQESGMDAESLTAIVELQRAIAAGEADEDQAMDLIAAHAHNVANATGIVIGLLKADQLVYRAGSGRGATYVGQHVMATLCVPAHNAANGEILRVENAQTDRRIEAAICRQFGAQSLLILPVYHHGTMAGVLDVLFDQAHTFQHREVLAYRLMAALVGEAMYYAAHPEQKKVTAADLSTMRQTIQLARPQRQREEALSDPASAPASATTNQASGSFIALAAKLLELTHSAWTPSNRVKHVFWHQGRWATPVAIAAVLATACWIGLRDRRPAPPLGVSAPQGSNDLEQPMPFAPATPVSANTTSKPQTALGLEPRNRRTSRTMPQRAPERNVRIRYISDDVTVRYFTPKPPPQRAPDRNVRVRYISDDVTVRYFTPKPAVVASPTPGTSPEQPLSR